MRVSPGTSARAVAVPLSATQAAYGLLGGAYLPFFAASLEARGLASASIGILIALVGFIRIPVAPVAGLIADAHDDRRLVILVLSALALIGFAVFAFVDAVAQIFLSGLIALVLWMSSSPIIEGASLSMAERYGIPYGRVRVWASIAFMAGNIVSGLASARYGFSIVAPWFVASCAIQVAAIALVPPAPRGVHSVSFASRLSATMAEARELASKPVFVLFLLVGSLIQGSHIFYYTYAGLHWREEGLSAIVIGLIWPIGIIAEILLFTFSAPVVRRVNAVTLMTLGACACVLRWTLMAFDPSLPALVAIQFLHGFSFAVPHLGAMYFILKATPPRLSATAQSLYGVVAIGLMSSLMLLPSSYYYEDWGGRTYLLMSGMALAAVAFSMLLAAKWNGARLTETDAP